MYFGDINIDSPVKFSFTQLENHDVKTYACRVAAKKKVNPHFQSYKVRIPLITKRFGTDTSILKSWLKQNHIGKLYVFFDAFFLFVTPFLLFDVN